MTSPGRTTGANPLPTPTSASDCGDASYPGTPDGGVVAGVQWPSGRFSLGGTAEVFICVGHFAGSTVRLSQTGAVVQLSPTQIVIPADSNGVFSMRVTVTGAGSTPLRLEITDPKGNNQVNRPGPTVVADASGWHFEKAT